MSSSHVSSVLRANAQQIIDEKLAILRRWSTEGIPWAQHPDGTVMRDKEETPRFVYFPTDIKSFAEWDASQYLDEEHRRIPDLLKLRRFARSTLAQPHNIPRHETVSLQLRAVQVRAISQMDEMDFTGKIKKLESARAADAALIKVQEHEIGQYRKQAAEERKSRLAAEKKFTRHVAAAKERFGTMQARLQELTRFINSKSDDSSK